MCGIAGLFNLDRRPVDTDRLAQMGGQLRHRGPDDQGAYTSGAVGLVNRRLAIIDLDTGTQPVCNEDGTVWVVLNGEIYNYVELRAELEAAGHRFKTRTDTEVIVHLYEQRGLDFLSRLRGMFAFALWDDSRRRLVVARDRLGEKPLFYRYAAGRSLAFGSELKAVVAGERQRLSLNYEALQQYLDFSFIPAPASIFTEIQKLPPGHYLVCTEDGLRVREYWDVPVPHAGDEQETATERLLDAFRESVTLQLRSDVPLGAFLSGGVDSTSIVTTMIEALRSDVVTCSIGFDSETHNELPYATAVARSLRTTHEARMVHAPSPQLIERIGWHFDEPFADSSAVPTWAVSALARERVKVALSGDGGDELFGGYGRHVMERLEHVARRFVPRAAVLGTWANGLPRGLTGANALRRLQMSSEDACVEKFRYDAEPMTLSVEICTPDVLDRLRTGDAFAPFRAAYQRAEHADPINRILYVDLKTSLADDMLTKVDRMSMAHGLEVRAPFLDHRFVELVASLPGRRKVRGRTRKPLLRAMLDGRVGSTAWDRPKQGFSAPVGRWLRAEPLRGFVEETLFSSESAGVALFDRPRERQLWDEHVAGQRDHETKIWILLMLEVWYRNWRHGSIL
jgi:asparagine synthase (glutamine-hydrolysing)